MLDSEKFDFLRFENKLAPKAGRVLLANPFLPGEHFRRSVVFLVEHDTEGTLGFVLNREVKTGLADILVDIPADNTNRLYLGGPVQLDTLHFLHTNPVRYGVARALHNGLYWGSDFDRVKLLLELNQVQDAELRFLIGYAGWSPGQLEGEIEEESWVVAEADAPTLLQTPASELWGTLLQQLGQPYATMRHYPVDARLN